MKCFQCFVLQKAYRFFECHHVPNFEGYIGIELLGFNSFENGYSETTTVDIG